MHYWIRRKVLRITSRLCICPCDVAARRAATHVIGVEWEDKGPESRSITQMDPRFRESQGCTETLRETFVFSSPLVVALRELQPRLELSDRDVGTNWSSLRTGVLMMR